jgi:hypothetical protein
MFVIKLKQVVGAPKNVLKTERKKSTETEGLKIEKVEKNRKFFIKNDQIFS